MDATFWSDNSGFLHILFIVKALSMYRPTAQIPISIAANQTYPASNKISKNALNNSVLPSVEIS